MLAIRNLKYLFFALGTFMLLAAQSSTADAQTFPQIAENIVSSINTLPGLIAAISYTLGTLFGVLGVIKVKDHVENPNNTPLKIPAIHLAAGGGLFALPTIIKAVVNAIDPTNVRFNPPIETLTEVSGAVGATASTEAGLSFNAIFANLVFAMSNTPLLIYAFAYLIGAYMAAAAVLKLKEHVEDQNKAPLKAVAIRFIIAGALLTLPSVFNAMATAISPNFAAASFLDIVQNVVSIANYANAAVVSNSGDANQVFTNILASTSGFPTLLSSLAFFLSLVVGIGGVFKLKEHVEDERQPLREAVIRFVVAGALIALPVIFSAIYNAIAGTGALLSAFSSAEANLESCSASASSLGGLMCQLFASTTGFPIFLTTLAYFAGTAIGFWAILQFQEHVTSPQQTKLWDPFSKMLAAGGLFALPTIVTTTTASLTRDVANNTNTGFNESTAVTTGLDGMLSNLMIDVFLPFISLINWFGILAGFILIFIGITRLMKSAQEGAKGPGGIGTIMTFVAGGALISFSPMISVFLDSVFGTSVSLTHASLAYDTGMDDAAIARSNTVIAAILRFVLLLGLVSIMRGIFIVRGVSEGNSQASMMAGMTHIVGGAIAVNLGGFIQVIQTTLGITTYGLEFGGGG